MMAKDRGFSWVIALACCFINCLLYGVTRLSGLLLVSTVETYQVTRATAAIPFSVSTSVRNLSGIFVGYLGQKFGLRLVISTGCLLASLGAGFCFFASDVFWITVFWGGMFGIGCGFATCLLPLAINDHFEKHRGTALGISYSGSYIGSFIFPPVVVQLIDKYGLPGAFLVISATLLNGLAASLLFGTSSEAKEIKNTQNSVIDEKQKQDDVSLQTDEHVQESYYKRLWFKLLYHIKKVPCLLKSKELSDDRVQAPIHLTSAVSLKDPGETECVFDSAPSLYVPFKRPEGKCTDSTLMTSSFKRTGKRHLKYRPGDFYLHCKTSTFKSKPTVEYKNKIAKLRKITLVRFFKKRYNFSIKSQLPKEDVKLVSIKNADGSFYATFIRNINQDKTNLFANNWQVFVSDKAVCSVDTEEISSVCICKKMIKSIDCSENLKSQITKFKTICDFSKFKNEFSSSKADINGHCNLETGECFCTSNQHQPHCSTISKIDIPNFSSQLESLESHQSVYSDKTTCNGNCKLESYENPFIYEYNQTFSRLNCNEKMQKGLNLKNVVFLTKLSVPNKTKDYSRTIERDSSIEGTCRRRISRQEQHHFSYSPSGSISESKNLEDSILCSCATNNLKLLSCISNNLEDPEFSSCCKKALKSSKFSSCFTNNPEHPEFSSCSKKTLKSSKSSSCITNNPKDPEFSSCYKKTLESSTSSSCTTNNPEDSEFSSCSEKTMENSKSSSCFTNNPEDPEFNSYSKMPSLGKSLRIESPIAKHTAKCCFGWFRMYSDPMFVVITTTMSLHTFVVVCMITIIEDFAKDLHVPDNRVHLVLMALSIADLFGALTLGVITDRRFMSSCCFVVLCFFGAGVCIIAISYSRTLTALLALVSCYGIFETGVVITLPLLITQFIEEKRQAIALAASNILSSPTVMLVPLVIGYFRDRIGCYSGVFYVLAITSFSSSLIWLVAPYLISKYRSRRKNKSQC